MAQDLHIRFGLPAALCFVFKGVETRIQRLMSACQSGATIVVQLLSSASKAPTAYFLLIKSQNNNYNLCSVFICRAEILITLRTKGFSIFRVLQFSNSMLEFIGSWHLLQHNYNLGQLSSHNGSSYIVYCQRGFFRVSLNHQY